MNKHFDRDEEGLPWGAEAKRRELRRQRRMTQVARGILGHRVKPKTGKRFQVNNDQVVPVHNFGELVAKRRRHEGRSSQVVLMEDLGVAEYNDDPSQDVRLKGVRLRGFNRVAVPA